MSRERVVPPNSGVVTFLDVLGWKGIYDRKEDAIACLTFVIEGVRSRAEKQRGRISGEISIKSISDTIVICTPCGENEISIAIEIHGLLCHWVIPQSIDRGIPVRGATSYGEFETTDNIFVGKAIDEAAAWHEQSDWIGVHLTPSAEFVFQQSKHPDLWKKHSPPNKSRVSWEPHCVNWVSGLNDGNAKVENIKSKFRQLGPIVPEITGKFINTLDFIEKMVRNQKSPEKGDI